MRLHFLALTGVVAIDQASKFAMLKLLDLERVGHVDVAAPYVVHKMAQNTGMNFSLLSGGGGVIRWALFAFALPISAYALRCGMQGSPTGG